MKTIVLPILATLAGLLRTRALIHMEILALRQQLAMVTERNRKRLGFHQRDRFFRVLIFRIWPGCLQALHVFKADTLVRWHRKGFRHYWAWKSLRRRGGRAPVAGEVRKLIRRMSRENVGWGAPRIHSELQMLGINIAQATVAKYMMRRHKPPSQTWRTFLDNHARDLASVDFFTVPTVTFRILYVFLVLRHDRRQIVHFNVTAHPTTQWTAQQLVEAFPFDTAPRYLLRDRDAIYGERFRRRLHSLGIAELPIAPPSPGSHPMSSVSSAPSAASASLMPSSSTSAISNGLSVPTRGITSRRGNILSPGPDWRCGARSACRSPSRPFSEAFHAPPCDEPSGPE